MSSEVQGWPPPLQLLPSRVALPPEPGNPVLLRCRSSRKRSRGAAGAESEPEVSGDDVAATFEGFQGVAFGLVSWGGWDGCAV